MDDDQNTTQGATTPAGDSEEANKKMEAVLAMEGEEGRLRREQEEKEQKETEMINALEAERTELNEKLATVTKQKEDYEVKWIDLSDKKKEIQKILDPILANEIDIEKAEQAKSQEEHATDDPAARQGFEKERQALEIKRDEVEKEKWKLEDEKAKLDALLLQNTTEYQVIIKDEYTIQDRLKEIDATIKSIRQ